MAIRFLLGLGVLALIAGTYSVLAWKAALRFGPRALLIAWASGSLLLGFYYFVVRPLPREVPIYISVVGGFAVVLAFGLATRSVRKRVALAEPIALAPIAAACGAFFLGLFLGLVPLLILDMLPVFAR